MIALDESGQMIPTRVVESVQFRTTRKRFLFESFTAHVSELNRALLFDGKQGGLLPIAAGERIPAGFGHLGSLYLDQNGNASGFATFPKHCTACHPPRRLETFPNITWPAQRSISIEKLSRWKEKKGDLDLLRKLSEGVVP